MSNTDTAATKDELGLEQYYEGIANYIIACDTPMTIALQGGWGSGKTTLFNLVKEKIEEKEKSEKNEKKTRFVELNTWQASTGGLGDDLTIILLEKIAEEVKTNSPETTPSKSAGTETSEGDGEKQSESPFAQISEGIKKLRIHKVVSAVGRQIPGVVPTIISTAIGMFVEGKTQSGIAADFANDQADSLFGTISNVLSSLGTDNSELDAYERLNSLKSNIEKMIDGEDKLVVFVDDLDRLEPRMAVDLLEGMKNFMDVKNCVFVLAIDEDIVFDGVIAKYGKERGEERKRLFFEKIIQVPFELPVDNYNIETYIQSLMYDDGDKILAKRFADATRALAADDSRQTSNNPRRIKRYYNLYRLYKSILLVDNSDIKLELNNDESNKNKNVSLYALLLFKECFEDSFGYLVKWAQSEQAITGDALKTKLEINENQEVDEDVIGGLLYLRGWLKADGEKNIYNDFANVLKGLAKVVSTHVVTVSFTGCIMNWRGEDEKWRDIQANRLNKILSDAESPLIERDQSNTGWLIADKGKQYGLVQDWYSGKDGEDKRPFVKASLSASRYGSEFEKYCRGKL